MHAPTMDSLSSAMNYTCVFARDSRDFRAKKRWLERFSTVLSGVQRSVRERLVWWRLLAIERLVMHVRGQLQAGVNRPK